MDRWFHRTAATVGIAGGLLLFAAGTAQAGGPGERDRDGTGPADAVEQLDGTAWLTVDQLTGGR